MMISTKKILASLFFALFVLQFTAVKGAEDAWTGTLKQAQTVAVKLLAEKGAEVLSGDQEQAYLEEAKVAMRQTATGAGFTPVQQQAFDAWVDGLNYGTVAVWGLSQDGLCDGCSKSAGKFWTALFAKHYDLQLELPLSPGHDEL